MMSKVEIKYNREVLENQDIMPQYQLLFEDEEILSDALRLVFCAMVKVYADPDKRKEISSVFKCFVEDFFSLSLNCDDTTEFDTINDEDVKVLLSDSFLIKRLENMKTPLDDLLKDREKQTEKKKKAQPKQPQEIKIFNMEDFKEIFIFETKRQTKDRFWPKYLPDQHNLFYASRQFYDFFRNFHFIYERLKATYNNIQSTLESEIERRPEIYSKHEADLKDHMEEIRNERYKQIFYRGLTSYILGELDNKSYELLCEWIIGSRAYLLFTIANLTHSVTILTQHRSQEYSNNKY